MHQATNASATKELYLQCNIDLGKNKAGDKMQLEHLNKILNLFYVFADTEYGRWTSEKDETTGPQEEEDTQDRRYW